VLLGDIHGGSLTHHDADRQEDGGEQGEQHHQTMAYQSVQLPSGHGQHTAQGQHTYRAPPSPARSQGRVDMVSDPGNRGITWP
jgi:hypothetical protein